MSELHLNTNVLLICSSSRSVLNKWQFAAQIQFPIEVLLVAAGVDGTYNYHTSSQNLYGGTVDRVENTISGRHGDSGDND